MTSETKHVKNSFKLWINSVKKSKVHTGKLWTLVQTILLAWHATSHKTDDYWRHSSSFYGFNRAGEDITFADLVLAPFSLREYILKGHRGLDDSLLSSEYKGMFLLHQGSLISMLTILSCQPPQLGEIIFSNDQAWSIPWAKLNTTRRYMDDTSAWVVVRQLCPIDIS